MQRRAPHVPSWHNCIFSCEFFVLAVLTGQTENSVKTILLVAGLLGCCSVVSADHVGDTFVKMRVAAYFRNPLAFPEPGIDIVSGADMLAVEQSQTLMAADVRTQITRGENWFRAGDLTPSSGAASNGIALWSLLVSTFASLLCGGCLSMAGTYVPHVCTRSKRRRVKVEIRKLAGH